MDAVGGAGLDARLALRAHAAVEAATDGIEGLLLGESVLFREELSGSQPDMPVPGAARIDGLTITMYDIVMNVVTPPMTSRLISGDDVADGSTAR